MDPENQAFEQAVKKGKMFATIILSFSCNDFGLMINSGLE